MGSEQNQDLHGDGARTVWPSSAGDRSSEILFEPREGVRLETQLSEKDHDSQFCLGMCIHMRPRRIHCRHHLTIRRQRTPKLIERAAESTNSLFTNIEISQTAYYSDQQSQRRSQEPSNSQLMTTTTATTSISHTPIRSTARLPRLGQSLIVSDPSLHLVSHFT